MHPRRKLSLIHSTPKHLSLAMSTESQVETNTDTLIHFQRTTLTVQKANQSASQTHHWPTRSPISWFPNAVLGIPNTLLISQILPQSLSPLSVLQCDPQSSCSQSIIASYSPPSSGSHPQMVPSTIPKPSQDPCSLLYKQISWADNIKFDIKVHLEFKLEKYFYTYRNNARKSENQRAKH